MAFSVPLWGLLAGQCLLTTVIIIAVFVTFNVQTKSSISDEVLLRIQGRMVSARETLLDPFSEGFAVTETLAAMSLAEPNRFAPTDNQTMVADVEQYRYAGSAVANSQSISAISQVFESKNAPIGYPFLTYQITTKRFDSKEYGGRYNIFLQQACKVNNSVYAKQPLIYQGVFPSNSTVIFGDRLSDRVNRRHWTIYPLSFTTKTQQTIINASGLPQTIEVINQGFSKVAMYSTIVGQMGLGLRYYSSWLQVASIDLSSVEPLLLALTDNADGEKDSYAAMYDLGFNDSSKYQIMAVSHPAEVDVVDRATQSYHPASHSGSAKLDNWFAQTLSVSTALGKKEGAFHTDDNRFLAYAHIQQNTSQLHLFTIVSTSDKKYFAKVQSLQKITIAIGVSFAVLIAALCVLIIYFVSKPIRSLKEGMALAATLQNERVVPSSSFLFEINSLCVAFAKMNTLLTEAKAYMPASMMARFSSSDSSDDEGEVVDKKMVSTTQMNLSESHFDSSKDDHTATSGSRQAIVDAQSLLRNRRVAMLAVNVRDFTSIPGFSIASVAGHSATLLDFISSAASTERGVIDSFHGDNFMISFNAIKPVGSPGRRAVQCATTIHYALSATPYKRLSMGVSCGHALVGSLGNVTQRRLSIIGSCYTKAIKLQRASAAIESSFEELFNGNSAPASVFHCLTDASTRVECAETFDNMLVGLLCEKTVSAVPKVLMSEPESNLDTVLSIGSQSDSSASALHPIRSGRNQSTVCPFATGADQDQKRLLQATSRVFAIVVDMVKHHGAHHQKEDEWMYEVHQNTLKNPFRIINEAMELALSVDRKDEDILNLAKSRQAQFVEERRDCAAGIMMNVVARLESPGTLTGRKNELRQIIVPPVDATFSNSFITNSSVSMSSKEVAELSEWLRMSHLYKLGGDFSDCATVA